MTVFGTMTVLRNCVTELDSDGKLDIVTKLDSVMELDSVTELYSVTGFDCDRERRQNA